MGLQEKLGEFARLDTDVIALSTDTPPTLKTTADNLKLSYSLLSDTEKQVFRLYETVSADGGHVSPSAFVIDKRGIIRFRQVSQGSERTSPDTLLGVLQGL